MKGMRFLLVAMVAVSALAGCEEKVVETENEAAPYNDSIIQEQREIAAELNELKEALPTLDSITIKNAHSELMEQVQESLEHIRNMSDFEEDASLKEAAIDLFTFYENIFREDYGQILNILFQDPTSITAEEKAQIDSIAAQIAQKEEVADQQFRKVQQKFARENNLILKEEGVEGADTAAVDAAEE